MTWQRLDESTYIDDTLVTCAEYQLFIDEMREDGKYYQLDHWTSYQFPKGQAREPILGVRHSDAKAFCEWLTSRDDGEWKYRLPILKEAANFPVKSRQQGLLGYWGNNEFQFEGVGSVPKNVRGTVLGKVFDLFRNSPRDLARIDLLLNSALNLERDRGIAPALDIDLISQINLIYPFFYDIFFHSDPGLPNDSNLANALDEALNRNICISNDFELNHSGELDNYRFQFQYAGHDVEFDLVLACNRALDRARDLVHVHTRELTHVVVSDIHLNLEIASSNNLAYALHDAFDRVNLRTPSRERERYIVRNYVNNLAHIWFIGYINGSSLNATPKHIHTLEDDLQSKFERDLFLVFTRNLLFDLELILAYARLQSSLGNRALSSDIDRELNILIDIFILRERIAGRFPAFEGIRLVKERIR